MSAAPKSSIDAAWPPSRDKADWSLVAKITLGLAAPGSLDAPIKKALDLLLARLKLNCGAIMLRGPLGELVPFVVQGAMTIPEKPTETLNRVLAAGGPLAIDPTLGACHSGRGKGCGEAQALLLAAPILAKGEAIGLLTLLRPCERLAAGSLTKNLRLMSLVANLLGPPLLTRQYRAAAKSSATGKRRTRSVEASPLTIIGASAALQTALAQATRLANTNLTILLRGESGTGKELFAQAIHDRSPRSMKPFIRVNCAALPESMLESELFGHERGAFTGTVASRKGRFELAHGGTLLLDEIGDIPPSFQVKLLRVLQEGEFERVGGSKTLKVDVRVIAATHRNLEAAVASGAFRPDLYYRLCEAPIRLPSLRERVEDIPLLADHVLRRFNAENGRALTLQPQTVDVLARCPFPGNIRELENCVRSAAALTRGATVAECDLGCRNQACFSGRLRKARRRVHYSLANAPLPKLMTGPAFTPSTTKGDLHGL